MADEPESLATGTFTAKDGTQKMYVIRGEDADDWKWQDYNGIKVPPRFEVGEPLTPDGRFSSPEMEFGPRGVHYRQVDRLVTYKFEMLDGVPRCVSVILGSPPGLDEITAQDLRKVQIENALTAVLDFFAGANAQYPHTYAISRKAAVDLLRKRKRHAVTEDVLREVAEIYEENIDGAPTQAVAEHFGVELRTASQRVKRAREAGFITQTAKSGRRPQR